MLVLTRRTGEEIVIAGDICIKVISVHGRRVSLGIAAPPSIPVRRQEVFPHNGHIVPNGHDGLASPQIMPE